MAKLYYFPLFVRGEPIRMLLNHGKVQFEDVVVQPSDWFN
jgi:prostaglandin-H2 D-isomerase / glutathione transferase